MQLRRRLNQELLSEERLALKARLLKEQAKGLPLGPDREALMRRARQMDVAAHLNEWLTSPGLRPPTSLNS